MTSTSATTRPAWQRPHDRSDTILGVTVLVVVPVLAFVAAIAGLPLLAPSDPSPQDGGVEVLQHELAMRALTALLCCAAIAALLIITIRWRRTRINRYRFTTPPEWPTPPNGWRPPAGWQPPRDWPPAPADWQFWHLGDSPLVRG